MLNKMRRFFNDLGNRVKSIEALVRQNLSLYSNFVRHCERMELKTNEIVAGLDALRRRTTAYVGQGVSLTHLADDTAMYVNSHDFGPPANLINGGLYEPENLAVLLSFVRPDTVFLDIGANLGYFSLMIARRISAAGKVHAFEPNPELVRLLRASAYINGLGDMISDGGPIAVHSVALGDDNADAQFGYSFSHAGGATRVQSPDAAASVFDSKICRLDDLFGEGFVCDLVKIDVEGHEISALRGMSKVIASSKDIKILFEKMGTNIGNEADLDAFFAAHDMVIYAVGAGSRLRLLRPGELSQHNGYALAARAGLNLDGTNRNFFRIHPMQIHAMPQYIESLSGDALIATGNAGAILFHGPYWALPAGVYKFSIDGEISGEIRLGLATRFGHNVGGIAIYGDNASLAQKYRGRSGVDGPIIHGDSPEVTLTVDHDLIYFECIGTALSRGARIVLRGITVERIG